MGTLLTMAAHSIATFALKDALQKVRRIFGLVNFLMGLTYFLGL
jgi:hypothetical protein